MFSKLSNITKVLQGHWQQVFEKFARMSHELPQARSTGGLHLY